MPEEILNPSDSHVGWLAHSLAGYIYVIVNDFIQSHEFKAVA